jgi:hypothetical protein
MIINPVVYNENIMLKNIEFKRIRHSEMCTICNNYILKEKVYIYYKVISNMLGSSSIPYYFCTKCIKDKNDIIIYLHTHKLNFCGTESNHYEFEGR